MWTSYSGSTPKRTKKIDLYSVYTDTAYYRANQLIKAYNNTYNNKMVKRPRICNVNHGWTSRKKIRKREAGGNDDGAKDGKEEKRIEGDLEHLFEDLEDALESQIVKVFSRDNHIYFQAGVSKRSVEKLVELLDKQNEEYEKLALNKRIKNMDPEPIHLHITSYGGDLLMGFFAMDAIKNSKIPVYTIVEGYAASAASLMAVVGKKRFMTKNSSHLIHQLSSGTWGKFSEIEDDYYNCKRFMVQVVDTYVAHSNMSKDAIEEQLKHDSWWNSEKCLEVGLIDEVSK